jgi:hypothetical protein
LLARVFRKNQMLMLDYPFSSGDGFDGIGNSGIWSVILTASFWLTPFVTGLIVIALTP